MSDDIVAKRERALHACIASVEKAAKEWAGRSSNGALIWRVATDLLDDVWYQWRQASTSAVWWPQGLTRALSALATSVDDPAVTAAVTVAAGALNDYKEPEA